MTKAARKPRRVSFDNEQAVLREIAKEIDYKVDELEIEESSNYSGFGVDVYCITTAGYGGSRGSKEWFVVQDDDAERELALAIVKQDLESEPEIFNKNFIESHIDLDHLRDELYRDVYDSNYDRLLDMQADEFWEEAERYGLDTPEEDEDDEDWELPAPEDKDIDTVAEEQTKSQLKHPMDYLEEIYSPAEAVEQAIKIGGIDIEAAAEEAVSADGAGHFLSSYDGNTSESPSGFVWWRGN